MSGFSKKPRFFICPICGREYGSASLPIHMKACEHRYEMEQADMPAKLRRPLPKFKSAAEVLGQHAAASVFDNRPIGAGVGTFGGWSAGQIDAWNEASYHSYTETV